MKKIIPYILSCMLLSLAACWEEIPQAEKPQGLIKKENLKLLMIDLYIAESANNMRLLEKDTALPKYPVLYKNILDKHKVTPKDYENSLKYYSEDPEEINAIYDDVLERLTKMESDLGGSSTTQDEP